MINDLIRAMREAGIAVPEGVAAIVEQKIRQQYCGETVRIFGTTREMRETRARQIAKLGKMQTRQIATLTGLSARTIRRIRNGK